MKLFGIHLAISYQQEAKFNYLNEFDFAFEVIRLTSLLHFTFKKQFIVVIIISFFFANPYCACCFKLTEPRTAKQYLDRISEYE
jgi:hypothetical protein